MPRTINKHIRIDEDLWKRLEAAAGEEDITANRLLAELAERWLETREWPQSEVQGRVARASLFAAQAIALDMIAAGRKNEVGQVLDYVAAIVPGAAPEPLMKRSTASAVCGSLARHPSPSSRGPPRPSTAYPTIIRAMIPSAVTTSTA